jgi:hypothetical protein
MPQIAPGRAAKHDSGQERIPSTRLATASLLVRISTGPCGFLLSALVGDVGNLGGSDLVMGIVSRVP